MGTFKYLYKETVETRIIAHKQIDIIEKRIDLLKKKKSFSKN